MLVKQKIYIYFGHIFQIKSLQLVHGRGIRNHTAYNHIVRQKIWVRKMFGWKNIFKGKFKFGKIWSRKRFGQKKIMISE